MLVLSSKYQASPEKLDEPVKDWCPLHRHVENAKAARIHSLEFFLLDETAAIVVQDGKDLLHLLGALLDEATHLEELLRAEGVWCWRRTEGGIRNTTSSIQSSKN